MSLWRGANRTLRPFWIAVLFAVAARLSEWLVLLAFALLHLPLFGSPDGWGIAWFTLPRALGPAAVTALFYRRWWIPVGLRHPRGPWHFSLGYGLGALLLTLTCVTPALLGFTWLKPGTGGVADALRQALVLAPVGLGEELLVHGLGFQALRRSLGDVVALWSTSLFFGVMHLGNPNASWVAALIIALAGLLAGQLTLLTGSIWAAVGMHLAWNFFEGYVFGLPVSGQALGPSLWRGSALGEPGFWHGGFFGPEAAGWTAVVTALACVTVGLVGRRRRLT